MERNYGFSVDYVYICHIVLIVAQQFTLIVAQIIKLIAARHIKLIFVDGNNTRKISRVIRGVKNNSR